MGSMEDAFKKVGISGQANNNNQNRYDRGQRRDSGQSRSDYGRREIEFQGKVIDGTEEYDPIEEGKKLVERMLEEYKINKYNFKFTTSQLRKILAMAASVKNSIAMENNNGNEQKISSEMKNEIQYIRLKLVYQMGREDAVKTWLGKKGIDLPEIIKNIGDDAKRFNDFYRLLESIVAYKKFLIPNNEGR